MTEPDEEFDAEAELHPFEQIAVDTFGPVAALIALLADPKAAAARLRSLQEHQRRGREGACRACHCSLGA